MNHFQNHLVVVLSLIGFSVGVIGSIFLFFYYPEAAVILSGVILWITIYKVAYMICTKN